MLLGDTPNIRASTLDGFIAAGVKEKECRIHIMILKNYEFKKISNRNCSRICTLLNV